MAYLAGLVAAGGLSPPASRRIGAVAGANESAAQNVRESQQYEQLVCSNPAFRAKRIAQECGPITDPQLHQSCVASFDCGAGGPPGATSAARRPPRQMR